MVKNDPDKEAKSKNAGRLKSADRVPFLLRAWWLRDHREYQDVNWPAETGITSPLWSLHSDPLCDMGNLDYSYDE